MASTPQLKADFFKTLGHPVRVQVLELLTRREHAVAEMLSDIGVEPANLSQQLAVLRRANLVASRKDGPSVYYSLISPQVATLLVVTREILAGVLSEQAVLLEDLRGEGVAGAAISAAPRRRRSATAKRGQ